MTSVTLVNVGSCCLTVTGGFPSQTASDGEIRCFLWCQPEETIERTFEGQVHCEVLTPIWRHRNVAFLRLTYEVTLKDTAKSNSLQWRHNGCDSVLNHQHLHCLLNGLFRRRSKKTSKLRVTGLCVENSPMTGEFSAQMASNAEKCFHLMTSSCDHSHNKPH